MPTTPDPDRAWLAAFLLGEGAIMLSFPSTKKGRKDPRSLAPAIKLPNTDYDIVLHAASIVNAAGITHFVTSPTKPSGKGKKPSISLNLTKKKAVQEFLLMVRPWLVGRKSREADLVLDFLSRACSTPRYIPTERDYDIALQVRALHDKGSGERLQRLIAANAELTTAPAVNV